MPSSAIVLDKTQYEIRRISTATDRDWPCFVKRVIRFSRTCDHVHARAAATRNRRYQGDPPYHHIVARIFSATTRKRNSVLHEHVDVVLVELFYSSMTEAGLLGLVVGVRASWHGNQPGLKVSFPKLGFSSSIGISKDRVTIAIAWYMMTVATRSSTCSSV